MTGRVQGDKVTIWAVTSTASASGDNGADPNKIVEITDTVDATTMRTEVAAESFRVVLAPKYGSVYRGVAFVE